eukprot:CAMPEP_0197846482 /NCGR_PEP_ID=MMETSP1438-20131217/3221_1 /TAXON_ID=1461541 /ORGANISM="Pterosperma sp., Strain CCMP1384" /LENGTH=288 /DNA_ID=CAMNT_0043458153 /DNA_START=282 /DNA_END=1148 /DNA_ORIENTATION=+
MGTGIGIGAGIGIGVGQPLNFGAMGPMGGIASGLTTGISAVQGMLGPLEARFTALAAKVGMRAVRAGIGCGFGIGYGFGIGLVLKPGVVERAAESVSVFVVNKAEQYLPREISDAVGSAVDGAKSSAMTAGQTGVQGNTSGASEANQIAAQAAEGRSTSSTSTSSASSASSPAASTSSLSDPAHTPHTADAAMSQGYTDLPSTSSASTSLDIDDDITNSQAESLRNSIDRLQEMLKQQEHIEELRREQEEIRGELDTTQEMLCALDRMHKHPICTSRRNKLIKKTDDK